MELNEQQIDQLWSEWQQMGMKSGALEEELFDHFCCLVEENMYAGQTFELSKKIAFDTFVPKELEQVQKVINKHKSLIMTQIPAMTIGFILASLGLFLFSVEDAPTSVSYPVDYATNTSLEESLVTNPLPDDFAVLCLLEEPPAGSPLTDDFTVTSAYGLRVHPIHKVEKMHRGIDFKAPIGTPVKATSDGIVVKAVKQSKGYGNMIIIQHDDTFKTLYAQLSDIDVEQGQKVKKGQIIAKVGSSGASTGPHLHYEVIKDGHKVNPEPFLIP